MSYQEKRSIVSVISTVVIAAVYTAYMMQRYPQTDPYSAENFRFWGSFFLILIPVTIVAKIAIYIVFSIINILATREEEPSIIDERDQIIELKASRNALYIFAIGFVLAMAALVIGMPPTVMFIIFICSGIVTEIISDLSQFYFYRRGV